MANRFHINRKKGEIGACSAKPGNCPFGSQEEHYDSMVDAAQAYEKSMESQLFPDERPEREIYGSDLGLKLTPSSKFKGDPYLSPSDHAEVARMDEDERELYSLIRKEVGPALTHFEARNMIQSWDLVKAKVPGISADALRYQASTGAKVYDQLAQKLTAIPASYGKFKQSAELEATLTEDLAEAMNASRPYGFPEDEPARYRMDQRERGLLNAVAQLSGAEPREIKARIQDRTPVERNHEGLSDRELQKRQSHLSGLTRSTDAKRAELKGLNREVAIRDVLDSSISETEAYGRAAHYVTNRELSTREIAGLLGTPRPETIEKLDGDVKQIWEKNWRY